MRSPIKLDELVVGQSVALWKVGTGSATAFGEIFNVNDAEHTVQFMDSAGRATQFRLTTPHFWLMLFEDSMTGARCYSERGPFYVFHTPS